MTLRGHWPALFLLRAALRSSERANASSQAGGGTPCQSATCNTPLDESTEACVAPSPAGLKTDNAYWAVVSKACASFNSTRPPCSGRMPATSPYFSTKASCGSLPIEARSEPWSASSVRVFAQRDELGVDLPELLRATRRYFDATIEVQSRTEQADSAELVQVLLRSDKHGYEGVLTIQSRKVTPSDLVDARLAEQRGRAAGMSNLAERCATVWQVNSLGVDSELARLNLCAILASVALGPVLPDDGATLFGVRGAMERVEKLLRSI